MIEVFGNIWDYPAEKHCITTNGDVNRAGEAVMGRGVALQAKQRFPGITRRLAQELTTKGNNVHFIGAWEVLGPQRALNLLSFPVKHHWHEKADRDLIARSCTQLVELVAAEDQQFAEISSPTATIVIPRPGCGNGQLDWQRDVRPILADLLDDRFHIIDVR